MRSRQSAAGSDGTGHARGLALQGNGAQILSRNVLEPYTVLPAYLNAAVAAQKDVVVSRELCNQMGMAVANFRRQRAINNAQVSRPTSGLCSEQSKVPRSRLRAIA